MFCDFTTTACIRPEIINRCYKSFYDKLEGVDFNKCTLYINVDPIPSDRDSQGVIDIAKSYFGNIVYNIADKPNFPLALKWCWSQTTSDYVFHLEDDWQLFRTFNLESVLKYFTKNNRKMNNIRSGRMVRKKIIGVTPRAYDFRDRLSLTPTLFDGDFVRMASSHLVANRNPENKIIHKFGEKFGQYHYPKQHADMRWVRDIGRQWLDRNKKCHKNKKTGWVRWEEG